MTFPEPRYILTWGGVGWQDWEGGYRWRWTLPHLKFSFGAEHFLGRAVLEQGYFLIPVLPEIGKISRAVRAGNMRQRKMLGLGLQGKCFLVCVRPVSEHWKGGTHLRSHLPVIVVFIANGLPSEYTSFHCKYCLSQWEIIRLCAPHSAGLGSFLGGIAVALMKEKCGTCSWPHTKWTLFRNWLFFFFLGPHGLLSQLLSGSQLYT